MPFDVKTRYHMTDLPVIFLKLKCSRRKQVTVFQTRLLDVGSRNRVANDQKRDSRPPAGTGDTEEI